MLLRQAVLAVFWMCALLGCLIVSPAQAYDNDTHYVLTYYLARRVGFTSEQARQIASGNVSIDAEPMTEPMQSGNVLRSSGDVQTPRALFHAFPDSRIYDNVYKSQIGAGANETTADLHAKEAAFRQRDVYEDILWKRALETGNPGQYLHFYQDKFSHDGYWTFKGHAVEGHAPDFLSSNPQKAIEMAEGTIRVLQRFMRACFPREPLEPKRSEVLAVVRKLIELNPHDTVENTYFSRNVMGQGVPDWEKAAEYMSGVLGEALPNWIKYRFDNAGGMPTSPNWRVQGCLESLKAGELRVKVVDDANGKPLSGAKVLVTFPSASRIDGEGETVDGVLVIQGLPGTGDRSFRVRAFLKGFENGDTEAKFECTEFCSALAVVRLKRKPGYGDTEFEARLAKEEAYLKSQLEVLKKKRDAALVDFEAQSTNVSGHLTQLEAASKTQNNKDFAAKADVAAVALRGAVDVCALVSQAEQKLTNTLARMDENEKDLERILSDGQRAAARCADSAAANEAERKYKEAAALQHSIDQQAATLPFLAVQIGELTTKLTAHRRQRASAQQLLASVGVQGVSATIGALDVAPLETAWNELRQFGKDWAQIEAGKLTSRLAQFRSENADLVSSSTLNAGVQRLRKTIDGIAAIALSDEELRRSQARVQALKARTLKLPSGASNGKLVASLQTLRATIDDTACVETSLPAIAIGLETADTTRSIAQLAMNKLGGSLQTGIQACRTKLAAVTKTEADKVAAVAAKYCAYPGSEAYWDEREKRPMCRCPEGKRWNNAERTACVIDKEAMLAKANCSRYPNTEPRWNDEKGKVTCACIKGYRANAERNGCERDKDTIVAEKSCAANAEAYWNDQTQKADCRCKKGYKADAIFGDCEIDRQARLAAADCSAYPHTEPRWDPTINGPRCECRQGYRWNAAQRSCLRDIDAAVAATDCSRYRNSEAYWNKEQGEVRCRCINGTRFNAASQACERDREAQVAATDCSHYRNSEAYWNDERGEARCRCIAGTHVNQATGDCEYERVARPTPADCSRFGNSEPYWDDVRKQTRCRCKPGYQNGDGDGCVPSRATPPVVTPPRRQDRDEMFSIIASALSTTDENYRKYPECRYRRAVVLSDFVSNIRGGKGEIEASANALRNKGHTAVEVRYFADAEAPRWVEQWRAAEKKGYDACWHATRASPATPNTGNKASTSACFYKGKRIYPCNP